MLVNFRVGFADVESVDLNDTQINDLFEYFFRDMHLNQAIISVIKRGDKISEENIQSSVWHGLMQK